MEGDHWVFVSPSVMGKWIVRERSAGLHLCFDSSISLFIFSPTWSERPAKLVHLCVPVGPFDLSKLCKPMMQAY